MAEVINALAKSKKASLAPGWVECVSKKHPDKPYYFHVETGQKSWTPPLEVEDTKKFERKSKKRKIEDEDDEEFSDASPSAAKLLLDSITRPKLKAKVQNAAKSTKEPRSIDTPAMQRIRENLAKKKAAAAAAASLKKSNKSASKKNNETTPVPEKPATEKSTAPLTPSRRSQRSSSITSSSSMTVSDCSAVSDATSMGTRITRAIASSGKPAANEENDKASKLQKRPRVCVTRIDVSRTSISDYDDGDVDASIPKRIKKNTANERLNNLRKSLGESKGKSPLVRKLNESLIPDDNDDESKSNCTTAISPKDTLNRLFSSESQLKAKYELRLSNGGQQKLKEGEDSTSNRLLERVVQPNVFCEEMEWEPIEDEKIMSEVHSARIKLCENPVETLSEISHNVLTSLNFPGKSSDLYVVVDTNVFLSNLPFIEEVRDSSYSDKDGKKYKPFIVVPWTVLQELDYIKDDKNNTRSEALKYKARKAIEFLNCNFTANNSRFLGQTPTEVQNNREKFSTECPDDEILQTCLQIKESSKSPVLLSYDKNLSTKAMIHDVPILGRDDPLEKMYFLKAAETRQFLSNSLHARIENQQEEEDNDSIEQKELLAADDIMEEGKAILKTVLSQVVAKEMELLFGSRWEKHVIVHPPWTVKTVLKCALKHWMAAVSESFERKTEQVLRDLQICINTSEGGRKLKDVKVFLDKCHTVFQSLNDVKHPIFKPKVVAQIDDLIQKCSDVMEEINGVRFNESVGVVEENEEENRACVAFKVFEEIYAFARDICGMASEALGLQCAFAYNKFNPSLTAYLALQQQQGVGTNINSLLQILRVALSKDYKDVSSDDKVILSLYQVLASFSISPSLHIEELSHLKPIDLYCCIKLKRSKLEKGYEQLQELAIHFCRMANFQCS